MKMRKSSIEIKGLVKKYLAQGLKQTEIAKLMNMTRQGIYYWIQEVRKSED